VFEAIRQLMMPPLSKTKWDCGWRDCVTAPKTLQRFELFGIQASLTQDAAKRSRSDFAMFGNSCSASSSTCRPCKFDVAACLSNFNKARGSSLRLTRETVAVSCSPNVHFDVSDVRDERRYRRSEVKFESIAEIIQRLIFGCALTGDINLNALSDVPITFLPDARAERLFHEGRSF